MSKITNIGVIGCGTISRAHFEAIQANDCMKLVGVADHEFTKAEFVAKQYGCKAYSNNLELICDPEIQVVVLLTPPGYHHDLIKLCALHKKHILAEKPIGISIESIDSYIGLCKENGVLLSVISQHRFDPATIFARKKIKEGNFGKIIGANCVVNWYRDDAYYDSWRGSKQLAGGGVLAIQAIHTIDLMLWLMGEVESVKAYTDRTSHQDIDVEDTAMACLKFKNGSLGVISATTSAYPGYPARLDILGTDGSLTIEGDQVVFYHSRLDNHENILITDKGETVADPGQVSAESIGAQYQDFLEALEQGYKPAVTSEEARKAFQLLDAIYRSSETGEEIKLHELIKGI
ncbi:Gfo/Idh/MocA family protein [Peribacillus sp. NPDC058002]|uniref:Gfo/Idh/MocA family protein n=1 Tax=Peribacillus sp. NPDC058002 TaxID=3346301 RepID=UPI0036D96C02